MPAAIDTISESPIAEYMRPGSLIAIYGPTNCGKSALARWMHEQWPATVLEDDVTLGAETEQKRVMDFIHDLHHQGKAGIWALSIHARRAGPSAPETRIADRVHHHVAMLASLVLVLDYPVAGSPLRHAWTSKARHTKDFGITFTLKDAP